MSASTCVSLARVSSFHHDYQEPDFINISLDLKVGFRCLDNFTLDDLDVQFFVIFFCVIFLVILACGLIHHFDKTGHMPFQFLSRRPNDRR